MHLVYPQIFHNHCILFLVGITIVPREDNVYAKFLGGNKLHYGA